MENPYWIAPLPCPADALAAAGLACVTEEDFMKAGKLKNRHTVDHICVDRRLASQVSALGAWERERVDGLRMIDHSGVWVQLAVAANPRA